jgi:hypothetical protein
MRLQSLRYWRDRIRVLPVQLEDYAAQVRDRFNCVVNRHRFRLPCTESVQRSESDCDGCRVYERDGGLLKASSSTVAVGEVADEPIRPRETRSRLIA